MRPKTNTSIFFTVVFICLSFNSMSQTPLWQWINMGGSISSIHNTTYSERIKSIGTDANGNIYVASPIGTGGISIDTITSFNGYGYDDFIIISYTCEGKYRWHRLYGSYADDALGDIKVTPQGDVYVYGSVFCSVFSDSHLGDTTILASNANQKACFLAKLDSLGNTKFLKFPGSDYQYRIPLPHSLEFDNNGNLLALSWFADTITWGNHFVATPGPYVVRYNKTDGAVMELIELSFKNCQNQAMIRILDFSVDTDNSFYIRSAILDTLFIGNDTVISSSNPLEIGSLLAKFDPNGNNIWYHEISGIYALDSTSTYQLVTGKPVFIGNSLYLTAQTQSFSTSKFLGESINNPIAKKGSLKTIVIAKFNKNSGQFINSFNLFHKGNIEGPIITAYEDGLIAVGAGGLIIMTNNVDTVIPYTTDDFLAYPFILRFDTGLTSFSWGNAVKVLYNNVVPYTSVVHVDHNNNILVGGSISGAWQNSFGDTIIPPAAGEDFFLAKIANTNSECGCTLPSPILSLVGSLNNELTLKGFCNNQQDSLYIYWGDGDSTLYAGQNTHISHAYNHSGPYNVCLRAWNICGFKDTCLTDLYSGISETIEKNLEVVVYPNPFNGSINIQLTYELEDAHIMLMDLQGRVIANRNLYGSSISIPTESLSDGVYFLSIIAKDGTKVTKKLVKK